MPELTKKQRRELFSIIAAALLLIAAYLIPAEGLIRLLIFLIPYLVVGRGVLLRAVKNIAKGQVFDENFLMALATVGALAIGEYPEAVFVMLFYEIGELFEHVAVGQSRKSIAALMDIRPDTANLETEDGIVETDPEAVEPGSVILVRAGERIPIDGVILEGTSSLDTRALTGESLPREVGEGDPVISGCVNISGSLRVRTTKLFGDSTVAKILDLVENSASNKAKSEDFITRFARWYTPAVVLGALAVAVIPPLVTGGGWTRWIHQALAFLVISCPCALVLSVPLSYFGGIGGASRRGILVKGSNYLEALASAETVVFDKTGTLTEGSFAVTAAKAVSGTSAELLEKAALAECDSGHPIAEAIIRAWGEEPDRARVRNIREEPGFGVLAEVDGRPVAAGSERLMARLGVRAQAADTGGTVIHAAEAGTYLGYITVSDRPKAEAAQVIGELRARGIRTVMLTGDRRGAGEAVASALGLDEVRSELLPADKVRIVEEYISGSSPRGKVVFVGDGINDAPVLARADIGIAMGALGSDAAIEAADVVLMDDDLRRIGEAIAISRRTNRIVMENISFALAVKLIVLALGLFGAASMWAAIFADVGVLIIAVLNAMRTLRVK